VQFVIRYIICFVCWLATLQASGVIFISGDVHFGEIARFDCGLTYPVYDITSSGLTEAVEEKANGFPWSTILAYCSWLLPETMRFHNSRCATKSCLYGDPSSTQTPLLLIYMIVWRLKLSVTMSHFYCFRAGYPNFGTFEIDWDAKPITVNVNVRDIHGTPMLGETLYLPDLQQGYFKSQALRGRHVQRHCTLEYDLPWYRKYILALNFFATLTGTMLSHQRSRFLRFIVLAFWLRVCEWLWSWVSCVFSFGGAVFVGALVTLLVLGIKRLGRPLKSSSLKED
jgi:alkaline phosphatase D